MKLIYTQKKKNEILQSYALLNENATEQSSSTNPCCSSRKLVKWCRYVCVNEIYGPIFDEAQKKKTSTKNLPHLLGALNKSRPRQQEDNQTGHTCQLPQPI